MARTSLLAIVAIAFIFTTTFFDGRLTFAAEQKTPDALEKEIQKENNPRKRAGIAKDLVAQRLQLLRIRIATGTMLEESSPELTSYQSAIDTLGAAVKEASHTGTSKNVEQFLRDQIHQLESFKMNVSALERPYMERIIGQAGALRGEILDGLMRPKGSNTPNEEAAQREPVAK